MKALKKLIALGSTAAILTLAPGSAQADGPNAGFLSGDLGCWIGLGMGITVVTVGSIIHSNNKGTSHAHMYYLD